jgi:hypothetical protein
VAEYTEEWADLLGLDDSIEIVEGEPWRVAGRANLVTNLAMVRPIDRRLIEALPADAAISLMWEPWELRSADLDLQACRDRGVPVLGTRETDKRVRTFEYVGMTVVKLLLEAGVEVLRSAVVLIGSPPFGEESRRMLEAVGADVALVDPCSNVVRPPMKELVAGSDAVVLVEHRSREPLVGPDALVDPTWIAGAGAVLVDICGSIDEPSLRRAGVEKVPVGAAPSGYMTVTTDYVGPRPVIDLHAGGLAVGAALVEGMRRFGDKDAACRFAVERSPAIALDRQP